MVNNISIKKIKLEGFPGGLVVNNLPASAGEMGSTPGPERFPYAMEQLSSCTHNCWSPVALEPVLCDKRSHCSEVLRAATRVCSVAQSCLTLWSPMDCSTPGFPVYHQLLELTQTHLPSCHTKESPCSNEDPVQPINKYIVIRKKKRKQASLVAQW